METMNHIQFWLKTGKVSNRTNNIDIRYRFITDYADEGLIKLKKLKSEDNWSGIMTMDFPVETFKQEGKEMLSGDIVEER